jgi:hypothetical protein
MMLSWKIRYFDRAGKQFKDRCLYLQTKALDPVTRAAIELVIKNKSSQTEREILKYRHLFIQGNPENGLTFQNGWDDDVGQCFCLHDYFEDETGKEMHLQEMGPILTGSPTAVLVPRGAKQHDLDLMFSQRKPIPVATVSLNDEDVRLLGYFARDLYIYDQTVDRFVSLHSVRPSAR